MRDMNDYIRACSQVEPLLNDYDKQLQRITDLYNQAQERDRKLLRVERLCRRSHLTNWESVSEILDITRVLNTVLKPETSIIQNMGACSSGMSTSYHSKRKRRLYEPNC